MSRPTRLAAAVVAALLVAACSDSESTLLAPASQNSELERAIGVSLDAIPRPAGGPEVPLVTAKASLGVTVLDLEDLPPSGGTWQSMYPRNPYHGIIFSGSTPYGRQVGWWDDVGYGTPVSGTHFIFNAYAGDGEWMTLQAPAVFVGAWVANPHSATPTFRFELYRNGVLVATSSAVTLRKAMQWVPSGYAGPVDRIVMRIPSGFWWVMDNLTFHTPNLPPTANAGPDQSVQANVPGAPLASVTLDASGSSDPDGDALTYTWTWDSGSASGPTPTVTLPRGTTTITLKVDDGRYAGTATDQVVVTVTNRSPTADAGPDQTLEATGAWTQVTLAGVGADQDGDPLEFEWKWPGGYAYGATATVALPRGTHTITLTVTDQLRTSVTDEVVVTILNRPPTANAGADLTVPGNVLGAAEARVTLDGSASADPDGDPLAYSWTWSGGSATGVSPTVVLPRGTTAITLTVSDGGATATDEVQVTVTNRTPSAHAGADQTLPANGSGAPLAAVTLDGSASSDPDGDALTYAWTWAGGTAAGVSPTVTLPRGTTALTLTVTDGFGGSATDDVAITVTNRAPEAEAGADQTLEAVGPTTPVSLDGSASTDEDGDALTYSWTWAGGSAEGATLTVELPLGEHVFTLTVDDGNGGRHSDQVRVTIRDTTAPTLSFALLTAELWPANHKMATVARGISAADVVDASVVVAIEVVSNEPDEGLGDGDFPGDVLVVDNGNGTWDIQLRAERSAKGTGRIYAVTVTATDDSGNVTTATGQVKVPLSQGTGNGKK